eukprot:scaffold75901_cov63-Phaeocystis_antarctica.AAC.1
MRANRAAQHGPEVTGERGARCGAPPTGDGPDGDGGSDGGWCGCGRGSCANVGCECEDPRVRAARVAAPHCAYWDMGACTCASAAHSARISYLVYDTFWANG